MPTTMPELEVTTYKTLKLYVFCAKCGNDIEATAEWDDEMDAIIKVLPCKWCLKEEDA